MLKADSAGCPAYLISLVGDFDPSGAGLAVGIASAGSVVDVSRGGEAYLPISVMPAVQKKVTYAIGCSSAPVGFQGCGCGTGRDDVDGSGVDVSLLVAAVLNLVQNSPRPFSSFVSIVVRVTFSCLERIEAIKRRASKL